MKLSTTRLHLLQSHGLNDSEARVYLTLLEHPTMTAGTLAKMANVPRSHLYKVLQDLHAAGLVDVLVSGRTRSYRAKPFRHYLERQAEEMRGKLRDVEETMRTVAPVMEAPPLVQSTEAETGGTRVVLGRRSVAREIDDLVERARRRVTFACTDGGWLRAVRHLAPWGDAWARADDPPLVEVLLPPAAAYGGGWEPLGSLPRCEVAWFRVPRRIMVVAGDDEEVLIVHPTPDTPDLRAGRDFAIFSRDHVLAQDQLALLRGVAGPEPPRRVEPHEAR
ncbi:MAG TPA: helix-turn-helix domain-containing protein [Candidatus Thermoplasmatota archaeon]|nr:helix-turn-helix domain-containing protein [Candidatus Thermoplasmatota archaeon]